MFLPLIVSFFNWFLPLIGSMLWYVPPFYWFLPLVCSSLCFASFLVQFFTLLYSLSPFLFSPLNNPLNSLTTWTVSPFEQFRSLIRIASWSVSPFDRFQRWVFTLWSVSSFVPFLSWFGFTFCLDLVCDPFHPLIGFFLDLVSPFGRFHPVSPEFISCWPRYCYWLTPGAIFDYVLD